MGMGKQDPKAFFPFHMEFLNLIYERFATSEALIIDVMGAYVCVCTPFIKMAVSLSNPTPSLPPNPNGNNYHYFFSRASFLYTWFLVLQSFGVRYA